jgi:hypothetical protein
MFGRTTMLERAAAVRGGPRAAGVAELVDALDLGSSDENRGGSNPSARTSVSNTDRSPKNMSVLRCK